MKQLLVNNVKEFFSDCQSYLPQEMSSDLFLPVHNITLVTIFVPMYLKFLIVTPFSLKLTAGFPCSTNVVRDSDCSLTVRVFSGA